MAVLAELPEEFDDFDYKVDWCAEPVQQGKRKGQENRDKAQKKSVTANEKSTKRKHQRRSPHLLRARVQSVLEGRSSGRLRSLCQLLALILGESNMFLFCVCLVLYMSCSKGPSHLQLFMFLLVDCSFSHITLYVGVFILLLVDLAFIWFTVYDGD